MTFNTQLINDLAYYSQQYLDRYAFLFPLGIIGIWRWSVWMLKEIAGLNYHPKTKQYDAEVSIVTPVYNENPRVFTTALASWKANKPAEIIAVIDHTDTTCIRIFEDFSKTFSGAALIVTDIPGKRPALAEGIKRAKSAIIAFVDSDTIWDHSVIRNGLPPFHDPRVAGVATYQSVLNPKSFAQKIFDIQLDLRYRHEYPFLAALGNALVCLSGRTAFYRKDVILPMVPQLVNETFLGRPVVSGDDKRLTYLVLAAGWKVAYQSNSHVYTPGMKDFRSYLKQRLRWTRNSLRADIKALLQGWPLRHPALFFFQVDKLLQSFVVVLSPIFFFIALYNQLWIAAGVIFAWWFMSRTLKIYPAHLSHKPHNIFIIPGFVFYSFFTGVVKIYALFSLNTQGWITRWDASRLPQLKFFSRAGAYLATIAVIMFLTYGVYMYKQYTYFLPLYEEQQVLTSAFSPIPVKALAGGLVLGVAFTPEKQLLVKRYQTKKGETLASIAKKFNIAENQLYFANSAKLPNKYIAEKTILSIPGKDMKLKEDKALTKPLKSLPTLTVQYDKKTNTLLVRGQGKRITLKDIRNNGGKAYLTEVSPKLWHAKASIYIYRGVTLTLDKKEVTWLRLESNKSKFVSLRSLSGDILVNGVKITSWDSSRGSYDTELADGRSFVMVKDNARLDLYDSELAYLGYPTSSDLAVSPYGVSWKMAKQKLKTSLLTGEVINSKFHHNYFGAYTYGATGMLWRDNQFYNNIIYGLDPHDDSNGFLVEGNIVYGNGTHGIIFSKRCMYNVIKNNISYNNQLHGIMLHDGSDFNIIENNVLVGNTSGVALWRSSNNIVRNNTIEDNKHGVRANESSNKNTIENNSIVHSKSYGIYFYNNAEHNLIHDNTLKYNNVALYIKSKNNEIAKNIFLNNTVGVYFLDNASDNRLVNNEIKNSTMYGIYTKIAKDLNNVLGDNDLYRNRKDMVGANISHTP